MTNKVRMADIAQQLGISVVSVSKGLAGKDWVSEELRRKILAAAQELGVTDAFDEISSQIEIVREEDENNRRIALDRDALTGEILAALPGILILFGYLIIPFLVKALALFNTYQESLQEFIG